MVRRKDAFREILGDFRRGKLDLLIGTQMIAKGLDFPNVTLVGLISADDAMALNVGDRAPDFKLQSTTGEKIRLRQFQGKKPVVLFFYIFAFGGT